MKRATVILHEQFNRLKVIADLGTTPPNGQVKRGTYVRCECDCGNVVEVPYINVKNGNSKSCGCLNLELISERSKTHGLTKHPLYSVHDNMKARTMRKGQIDFHRYGGRGIKICDEWLDFKVFYDWAMDNGWKHGLQVDRKDNDGNYCPENCRIVTPQVNQNNKSTSRAWVVHGDTYESSIAASEALGVPHSTIKNWCNGYITNGTRKPPKKGCWSYLKYSNNNQNKETKTENQYV